ncbi:MAG: hypothetical protein U1A78_40745 [Polyangia bacterium]
MRTNLPSDRAVSRRCVGVLLLALGACGDSPAGSDWSQDASLSLRYGCIYGIQVEPIIPYLGSGGGTTRIEVCFAERCGTATVHGPTETAPLTGALTGIVRSDGRGTALGVNVGENEVLRDGDVWQITLDRDGTSPLKTSRSVTYSPVFDYADSQEPRPSQCTGVTARRGSFNLGS